MSAETIAVLRRITRLVALGADVGCPQADRELWIELGEPEESENGWYDAAERSECVMLEVESLAEQEAVRLQRLEGGT